MHRALMLICALLFICVSPACASPGRTDGNGGHIDGATGEYHFHHGYPAHQHINGVCPLDPSFTSNVITGPIERTSACSEDVDDVVVPNVTVEEESSNRGLTGRDGTVPFASAVLMGLVIMGGFLASAQRRSKTNPSKRSKNMFSPNMGSKKTDGET